MHLPTATIPCCLAGMMLAASPASAQLMTNDSVSLTLTPGVQLTVKGDVHNIDGTVIVNNGTIDLTGHWIHDAANDCFGTSQGTVILNGGNQNIGGSSSTVFNNLTLQGPGIKTLQIDATTGGGYAAPSGVLDVGSAALDLNGSTLHVANTAPGAVAAGTGYILSEDADNSSVVAWRIDAVAGTHTIPFGNASGIQLPFSFEVTAGNAGIVSVSTYPTTAANTPYPVAPVPVTHVRNLSGTDNSAYMVDRFWEVDPAGTVVATLTFTYGASENAAAGNTGMRAQRWNPATIGWDQPLPGQTNPTTQSVRAPNAGSFGPWALALDISPLPVTLLTFTAHPEDNERVVCSWITATEINSDFFTVERSRDGLDYESGGHVPAAGQSTAPLSYAWVDDEPYAGVSFYRLKQVDFDGTATLAGPVAVRILEDGISLVAFPNPSTGMFFLQKAGSGRVDYRISDATGKKVFRGTLEGSDAAVIDATALAKGVYLLTGFAEDRVVNIRIVVQ